MCGVAVRDQHFGGPCCLHPKGGGRQQGPLKHWAPTTTLHGITALETLTWIFTVKVSNLANVLLLAVNWKYSINSFKCMSNCCPIYTFYHWLCTWHWKNERKLQSTSWVILSKYSMVCCSVVHPWQSRVKHIMLNSLYCQEYMNYCCVDGKIILDWILRK
jgi:hypothetical protein